MPSARRSSARPGRSARGKAAQPVKRKGARRAAPRKAAAAKRSARVVRVASAPSASEQRAADPRLVAAGWQHVRLTLREHGLLLESDAALPNVAALVAGEPVAGSWWSHPAGPSIFAVTQRLATHPDALAAKLVDGKTTWVHRRLWAALLSVATAGEAWQRRGLSPAARTLLARLQREGTLAASGEPARELQARLLALGEEAHTESGRHELRLVSWQRWQARDVLPQAGLEPAHGRLLLEEALRTLGGEAALARLPWRAQERGRRSQQGTTQRSTPRATPRGGRRAQGDRA
jgi:hypothetical protein